MARYNMIRQDVARLELIRRQSPFTPTKGDRREGDKPVTRNQ